MLTPYVINTPLFNDDRGLFYPLSLEKQIVNTDHRFFDKERKWIQSNLSVNKKWVFRGLHHQLGDTAQTKLVTVISGSILDFLVDLRYGKFNETYFFRLNPGDQLYVPKGFAHGFLSLQENTVVQYLIDEVYSPRTEVSFDWKSNETIRELILAEVGDESNLLIATKDIESMKICPDYAETIDYSSI